MALVSRISWRAWTLVFVALVGAHVISSPVRSIGDGREYLLYGLSLARGHGPSMPPWILAELGAELARAEPGLDVRPTGDWPVQAPSGEVEFIHFWLYPLAAVPGLVATDLFGLNPRLAFTALNVLMIVVTFAAICRRYGPAVAFLFCAGPTIWWVDKAHPETLLFSLTALVLILWRTRPRLALVLCGVLAAQVPPFGILLPLTGVAALATDRRRLRDRSFWVAAAAAVAIAALPVAWYWARFGRTTLLAGGGWQAWSWPDWRELLIPIADLHLGLFPNHPALALAVIGSVAVAIARRPARVAPWDLIVTVVSVGVLLFAFPQVHHWGHGGTPGINRFAAWLIPFALPVVSAAAQHSLWRRWLAPLAVASIAYSAVYFRPAVAEYAHRSAPTLVADVVMRFHPDWSRPVPAVFAELFSRDNSTLPASAPGCHKVLLVGRGESQGMWPRPCQPAPVVEECRKPGTLCWANARPGGYDFVVLSDAPKHPYDPTAVWPKGSEQAVRDLFGDFDWRRARPVRPGGVVRELRDVVLEGGFEHASGLIAVFRVTGPAPAVRLASTWAADIGFLDGNTGQPATDIEAPATLTDSTFDLRPHDLVIAVVRRLSPFAAGQKSATIPGRGVIP